MQSALGPAPDPKGTLTISCLQVLPFILRRSKEAVLKELPPKIVQDVLCTPSPLQAHLLQAFQQSPAAAGMADSVRQAAAADAGSKPSHVFQVGPASCPCFQLDAHRAELVSQMTACRLHAASEVLDHSVIPDSLSLAMLRMAGCTGL